MRYYVFPSQNPCPGTISIRVTATPLCKFGQSKSHKSRATQQYVSLLAHPTPGFFFSLFLHKCTLILLTATPCLLVPFGSHRSGWLQSSSALYPRSQAHLEQRKALLSSPNPTRVINPIHLCSLCAWKHRAPDSM